MKLTLQVAAMVASLAVLYGLAGWASGLNEHKRTAEQILDSLEKRQQQIEIDEKVEAICDWAWKRCVERGVKLEDCELPKECR